MDAAAAAGALIGATLYRMLSVTTPVHETIERHDGPINTVVNGLTSR